MSNDNSDSFELSRRKALAGLGGIGTATALGGLGTYAQFSDTEERAVTFTAGGIDGELTWGGSYNGEDVDSGTSHVSLEPTDMTAEDHLGNAVGVDVHFDDVKPGDFGCVNFGITVADNEAWVASCLNVAENVDYKNFEPEIAADSDVSEVNVDGSGDLTDGADLDDGNGELAQNIYTIPYYDSDGSCTFFDSSGPADFSEMGYDGANPSAFWSNAQDTENDPVDGAPISTEDGTEYYLVPRSVLDVSQNVRSVDTAHWSSENDQSLIYHTAPNGTVIQDGCVMLDGKATEDGTSGNNTQSVEPLQPGDQLNFGYDFHIPFGTGNVIQGDRTTLRLAFKFLQTRHTEAPAFGTYSPGSNTPGDS